MEMAVLVSVDTCSSADLEAGRSEELIKELLSYP